MRLLRHEQIAITNLLEKHISTTGYQLIKRKGWVYIQIHQHTFAFHRKKSVEIVGGKFEGRFQYFIRQDGTQLSVTDFDAVLSFLQDWVTTILNE